jgi:F0F1-type ATP synthase assembly protein I
MSQPRPETDSDTLQKYKSAARRSVVVLVIAAVLVVTVATLGFLTFHERITPEPFLLLVGILIGFVLGRLDVIL